MVYGVAIPVYRYTEAYIGRDEKQCLGPSARQNLDLAPEMHIHIAFSLTVFMIPNVAHLINFPLR
jgi:hypothetical protein